MSKWFNLYSFDVMGDLGFGKPFNMLESGEMHWAIKLLNAGMDPVGMGLPPWIFRVLVAIPGAAKDYHRFIQYCSKQLEDRMKMQGKMGDPDITHALIEDFNKKDAAAQKTNLPMLQGDSRLIIVAGSDTTAATLTHLFYHIASEPGLLQRLRDELDPLLGEDGHVEHQTVQDATLLNSCINETLRMNPPVPSGVFRKTPEEGVYIGETYVPGNTCIQMPLYAIGHGKTDCHPSSFTLSCPTLTDTSTDDSIYPQAEVFIPERHSFRPDLIKNKEAFAPFSIGPYGCIGKNLAYMEVRLLTTHLITKFDVALAPGEDGYNLLMRSVDHFTMGLGPLNLVFTRRSRK